jgi:ATP-dependent Clp protease ATP-binding subunit ClpA
MERHSVSKLIGSPPGYVGYGDGRALTEAVHKKPVTLILIDEIEKAHPDAFNILEVFEDGHLNNPQDLVNARNNPEACIVIQEIWFSFILEHQLKSWTT